MKRRSRAFLIALTFYCNRTVKRRNFHLIIEVQMSRPVIVVGDRTSHGGVVLTGSPFSDVNGKGIARIGDKVTCPQKGHGSVTTIVTGDLTDMIDGSPVARHGDKTACGATLISSQMLTYVDEGSDSGGRASTTLSRSAQSQAAASSAIASDMQIDELEQFFIILDEHGQPASGLMYRVDGDSPKLQQSLLSATGATKAFPMNQDISAVFWLPMGAGK